MAEPLKNAFSPALVARIADEVARVNASFDRATFLRQATRGLAALELTARARQVAAALREHLPRPFDQALRVIVASLGPPLTVTEGFGMSVFRYLPHVYLIAEHGPRETHHLTASLEALRELTQRFTSEWGIRPFIEQHHEHTMAVLATWARDDSVHVRRLVSEGTRARLPWAARLRCFQHDPTAAITLLDQLVDDPEVYVRRSVANHLGDIAKDHPELALTTARRWLKQRDSAERRWVVGHGLRSLIRTGDPQALGLLGFGTRPQVSLTQVTIAPRRVRIGGQVTIHALLVATGALPQELRVDLVVHYAKPNGSTRAKTFVVTQTRLAQGEQLPLVHVLKTADLATRIHHPGTHRLELLVNGERLPLGQCVLMR